MTTERITRDVRDYYASAAKAVLALDPAEATASAACCAPDGDATWGEALYDAAERAELPSAAVLASLG
ncbi:MAG TPA: hypothetical protein VF119_00310, partial [Candidatus Limnocylindrales bacterium]